VEFEAKWAAAGVARQGTSARLVGRVLVCEHASSATFVGASDLERTLVSATRRIGNNRTWWIGLNLAASSW
jgi:hypothetical protein